MNRVNVFGGTLADLNFALPKQFVHRYRQSAKIELPFGEKLTTEGYILTPGGSGANVAIGLAKIGCRVWFHTALADDAFGEYLRRSLKEDGLELDEAKVTLSQTPLSVILRVGGERTIVTARSAATSTKTAVPQTGWIHLGPLHGEVEVGIDDIVAHQIKTGQRISCNPSMEMIEGRSRSFMALLKVTTILFINRTEALALTRLPHRSSVPEILTALLRLGSRTVCLTDGEHGAYVADDTAIIFAPALTGRFERIDATGAGDAFTSGFLGAYLVREGEGVEGTTLMTQSLQAAIANSGSAVSAVGAQAGLLTLEEMAVDARRVRVKEVERS